MAYRVLKKLSSFNVVKKNKFKHFFFNSLTSFSLVAMPCPLSLGKQCTGSAVATVSKE